MNSLITPSNRFSFVNILCYLIILISSYRLVQLVLKLAGPEQPVRDVGTAVAEHLSDWQYRLYTMVQQVMEQYYLLTIIALLIAVAGVILAAYAIRRREWARKGLIVFFSIKILATLVSSMLLFLSTYILVNNISNAMESTPFSDSHSKFEFLSKLYAIMGLLISIGIMIFYGWIIKKLRSDDIKLQFSS